MKYYCFYGQLQIQIHNCAKEHGGSTHNDWCRNLKISYLAKSQERRMHRTKLFTNLLGVPRQQSGQSSLQVHLQNSISKITIHINYGLRTIYVN